MDEVECVVVGAGVVGLACGAALARSGREVIVLEAADQVGTQTSSRNSEVIHAGIYYPPRSLKAEVCRRGKEKLYDYARARGIPHRNIGKMIVASTEDQIARLKAIRDNAAANHVTDLKFLTEAEARALEPAVRCRAALLSPSTGIIDSHAFMLALAADLEDHGGMIVCNTPVSGGAIEKGAFVLETGAGETSKLKARMLVNSAGLGAQTFASSIAGFDKAFVPPAHFAIGHYYRLQARAPCDRLIYPVPVGGGLGVHLTLDLGGQAKFGPDIRWIEGIDYTFDDSLKADFVASIRSYLPDILESQLVPDYTGIRPKISGPSGPAADFRIDGPGYHGIEGLVNLFGIESPGLTSSLAIGDLVAGLLQKGRG